MPRAGLNRRHVIDTAADLADQIGLEKLTLAAVAKALGVRLPSLYNHIEGLEALRRELSVLALHELSTRLGAAAAGMEGKDALRATADAYRSYALNFPGRYTATLKAPGTGDDEHNKAAGAVLNMVISTLRGYRLTGTSAVDALRQLRASLHGWADLEKSGAFGMPEDLDHSYTRLIDHLHNALLHYAQPAPQSPNLMP